MATVKVVLTAAHFGSLSRPGRLILTGRPAPHSQTYCQLGSVCSREGLPLAAHITTAPRRPLHCAAKERWLRRCHTLSRGALPLLPTADAHLISRLVAGMEEHFLSNCTQPLCMRVRRTNEKAYDLTKPLAWGHRRSPARCPELSVCSLSATLKAAECSRVLMADWRILDTPSFADEAPLF